MSSADSNEVELSHKLNQVIMELDQVIAPRKEKYAVQGNAMAHYASEYKSRCIDYHRQLLTQHYTLSEKTPSATTGVAAEPERVEQSQLFYHPREEVKERQEEQYDARKEELDREEAQDKAQ